MQCPKCMKNDTTSISGTHYVCNNSTCINDKNDRTQFIFIPDSHINFPYNQIFVNRQKQEFYRKPYLEIESVGSRNITR